MRILIAITLLVSLTMSAQAQTARERLLGNTKQNGPAKGGNSPANAAKETKPAEIPRSAIEDPLNLNENLSYSKLLTFAYIPSQRDPFISHTVLSPFVTDDDLPPPIDIDQETVTKAKKMVESIIQSRIEIRGVSTGRKGAGFAVSGDGAILKPGEYLFLEIDDAAKGGIEEAVAAAQTAGMGLIVKTYQQRIVLETKRVEEKAVTFISPVKTSDAAAGDIVVEYTKRVGFDRAPQPGDLERKDTMAIAPENKKREKSKQ